MTEDKIESVSETILLAVPSDAWAMILDYIYCNLEWDSNSPEKEAMYAAMNRISNAHYFYEIQEKGQPGIG